MHGSSERGDERSASAQASATLPTQHVSDDDAASGPTQQLGPGGDGERVDAGAWIAGR